MPRLWFHHLHRVWYGLRGEGRLAAIDRVVHSQAVRAKRGICRLAYSRNLRVVVVGKLVDQLGQLGNERGIVEGVAQPVHHIVARDDPASQLARLRVCPLHSRRMLVQVADQMREDRLQVWVVLVTGGAGGTAMEEGIKRPLSRSREAGVDVDLWRG